MKQWFVVYTRVAQEGIAELNLKNQGFVTYLPRLALRRKQANRVASVTVPMFSRYLFVQVDLAAARWRSINGTFGVANLVSFGDRPAPVSDAVIEELRSREDEDGIVRLPKIAPFLEGESVAITDGPLSDMKAMFTARTEKERVFVLMSLLGRDVKVRVGQDRLRRAS